MSVTGFEIRGWQAGLAARLRSFGLLLAFALAFSGASEPAIAQASAAPAAETAATVEVTDGTVFVSRASGKRSIVAQGTVLQVGDTISTEKDSYARLRFTDGGQLAVRPSSSLLISNYHFKEFAPQRDALAMRLLKGGIRNLTGLIGKRGDRNSYRLDTMNGTIGIRGTDFIARICESDCAEEKRTGESGKKLVAPPSSPIAARLLTARGQTIALANGQPRRRIEPGDPVYVGETVEADVAGFATLVFSDETRVVIDRGSRYTVTTYRYTPGHPERGNMATDLIKGGMRVVTGLFAKQRPKKVIFDTVTGTIGIRGTNFDVWCAPSGNKDPMSYDPVGKPPAQCDQALYAHTRDGSIEIKSGQFALEVPKGRTGYIDAPGAVPVLLDETPGFMRDNPAPRPEDFDIDMPKLFGRDGTAQTSPGLYVEVKEGKVSLTLPNGQELLVGAGETGYASPDGSDLYMLGLPPVFLDQDPYLREMNVDPVSCRAQ